MIALYIFGGLLAYLVMTAVAYIALETFDEAERGQPIHVASAFFWPFLPFVVVGVLAVGVVEFLRDHAIARKDRTKNALKELSGMEVDKNLQPTEKAKSYEQLLWDEYQKTTGSSTPSPYTHGFPLTSPGNTGSTPP